MSDELQSSGSLVSNPLGATAVAPAHSDREAAAEVAVQRELAEVQGAVIMARRYPRNQIRAMDVILQACTRPSLAERALYNYSRGGTEISGASIRLAEVCAQAWGNISFGMREVEQRAYAGRPGESTIVAYAWDLETNVRDERVFQVKHERHSRSGSSRLTDPRDVYELVANQGARRLRACILAVIPGDVVEAAVEQCEQTMLAKADTSPEAVGKLVQAFTPFGVTREMIEARIQRRIESIRPAQIVQLRKVWSSLNDNMSVASDWFEMGKPAAAGGAAVPAEQAALQGNEGLKAKLGEKASPAPQEAQASLLENEHVDEDGVIHTREPGEEG